MVELTINAKTGGDFILGRVSLAAKGPGPVPVAENLIVASSREEALRVRDAFDLDRRSWDALGYRDVFTGKRYLRIVAVMPDELNAEVKHLHSHLTSLLWRDGELVFL